MTRPMLAHFCLSITPAALNLFSHACQRSRSLRFKRSAPLSACCLAAKLPHWREGLMCGLKYIIKYNKKTIVETSYEGKMPQEKMGSVYFASNRTTMQCYVQAVMEKKHSDNGKHSWTAFLRLVLKWLPRNYLNTTKNLPRSLREKLPFLRYHHFRQRTQSYYQRGAFPYHY